MAVTPLAPPSVQLVPAKEYNGAPIGTSYDIRVYVGRQLQTLTSASTKPTPLIFAYNIVRNILFMLIMFITNFHAAWVSKPGKLIDKTSENRHTK
jgi:hypothetical protein